MDVSIIGVGYVGLTTSVGLARRGNRVYAVDIDKEKIRKIRTGQAPIYEENLEETLAEVLDKDMLHPTTDYTSAVMESEVSFICVGTPSAPDGTIDLSYVKAATESLAKALSEKKEYHTIVCRSTVVPGTSERLIIPTVERNSGMKAGSDLGICVNPEFLREGKALEDFLNPGKTGIVVGQLDARSGDILIELYKSFDAEKFRTDLRTAEMIKYARNAYLAKDVSFANEIANLSQKFGIDYLNVRRGIEMDARIGKGKFLDAGVGFGGSCFPKDLVALISSAKKVGYRPRMLEATLEVNDLQWRRVVEMLREGLGNLKGRRIAVLGLAFKPGTDDMREASSVPVVRELLSNGAKITVFDPKAMKNAKKIWGEKVVYSSSAEEALSQSEACVIMTEWEQFRNPGIYTGLAGKLVVDGRRALDPNSISKEIKYLGVGYPSPDIEVGSDGKHGQDRERHDAGEL